MSNIKYLVCPGYILNDNQFHYVNAIQLMNLYKVNRAECKIQNSSAGYKYDPDLIELHPQRDGDYSLKIFEKVELK